MTQKQIQLFCKLFYSSIHIPLELYINDRRVLKIPDSLLDFTGNHLRQLKAAADPISHLATSEAFYGIVRSRQTSAFVVIGPVPGVTVNSTVVRQIMKDSSIAPKYEYETADYLGRISRMTFQQFIKHLALVHFGLNGDSAEYDPLSDEAGAPGSLIGSAYSNSVYQAKEEQFFHNTYKFELEFLKCVEDGNIGSLKKVLERPESYQEGVIADSSLRQAKNIFITTATLVTRSAILGGFDIESAYQLSDVYIREAEKLLTIDAVYRLSGTMIYDFTNHVAKSRVARGISTDVDRCIQYIVQNTNRPISVADVADHVGRSRSNLSRKFKAELGFEMSAYIRRCKLEEAKSLLSYTDKPISEISNYLCFASQSHFQNVFKKKYGVTPKMFRDRRDAP
ncbi:MAG TPA: hypothetical protein DCM45_02930 [Clostridiales bacterium]|nr:hypothetical protein [Clostridiales bacterium]